MNNESLVSAFVNVKRHPKSTVETYIKVLSAMDNKILKTYSDYTEQDARSYEDHLINNYAKTTVIRDLRVIKQFFRYLKARGGKDVFENVIVPLQDEVEYIDGSRIFTKEEMRKLRDEARKKLRNFCIIELLVKCRFMPIEITNFKWNNIFIDEADNLGIEVESRGGNKRTIPINEEIYRELIQYRISLGLTPEIPAEDDTPVFRKISNLRKLIDGIREKAGITKKISPKDLAHFSIIEALNSGATEEQAALQADFSSKQVLRKYAKQVPKLNNPMCNYVKLD